MATIYFSGSISGGRGDAGLYRRFVEALEADGHRVLAGAVAAAHVSAEGEALDARTIFERDLGWLEEVARAGGLVVAEVSMPSIGVGYEIAAARYRYGIPVICLWRPAHTKRCSAMVAGDEGVRMIEYAEGEIDKAVEKLSRAVRELGE